MSRSESIWKSGGGHGGCSFILGEGWATIWATDHFRKCDIWKTRGASETEIRFGIISYIRSNTLTAFSRYNRKPASGLLLTLSPRGLLVIYIHFKRSHVLQEAAAITLLKSPSKILIIYHIYHNNRVCTRLILLLIEVDSASPGSTVSGCTCIEAVYALLALLGWLRSHWQETWRNLIDERRQHWIAETHAHSSWDLQARFLSCNINGHSSYSSSSWWEPSWKRFASYKSH